MASEYSVNIKLNTKQVKTDLQTIGKEIGNLGKNQSKGSKQALSAAEKQLKLDNASLRLKNQALGLSLKALPLQQKGVKLDETASKIAKATADAEKFEFDLAKKSLLLADEDIKKAQIRLKVQNDINKATAKTVKVENTVNKQLREKTKTLGQIVKLRNLGSSAGRLAGKFDFEETLNTRGPGGRMLALPSAEMLDQRVRGSGQAGGFSRKIPRFRLPKPTRGFDAQSALISGGFPLLFGQGPVTAAAGAIGGGVGGMFGQMGGFAGGIAATAAVQAIQNTMDSVSKLGQAFNTLTPNVENLTAALGANGTERERQIQLIKKTQGTQAALAAVTEQMNQQIGEKGVKNLKEFGETSRLIGNSFQLLGTKMLAALAPVLNFFAKPLAVEAARVETNRLANVGGAANDEELQTLQTKLGNVGRGRSANKRRERIREQIEDRKEELALVGKVKERRTTIELVEDSIFKKQRQQDELLKAKLNGNYEEVLLAQQVNEKINEMLEAGKGIMEIDIKRIENQIKQTNELEKQVETAKKLEEQMLAVGEEIEGSIKNNLRDAITGAQSFGEAMSNVLNKIRDKMLDRALDNLFGGFGESFGKSVSGKKGGGIGGFIGGLFGFADGGRPPVGRPSIVGERGPELFVPRSAGTVVPNEKIGSSNITNNISINVDATNSNVQSDKDAQQFGEALASAIQSEIIKQKRSGGLLR